MKIVLILFVIFLILSAGFLMLSADAIRKSTDSLIVLAREKGMLFALSLSCAALWASWEEKNKNSIDVLAHERARKKRRSTNQHGLSDESDWSDKSDKSDKSENPH